MKTRYLIGLLALSLTACDFSSTQVSTNEYSCSGETAETLVAKILKDEVEKAVSTETKDFPPNWGRVGIADVRGALDRLTLKLDDVRTTEKTDKSRKLQCEATLKVQLPEDYLERAIESNKELNDDDTSDFFEMHFKREGGYYTRSIAYAVQPTDNNEKLFTSVNESYVFIKPLKELVFLYVMRPALMRGKANDIKEMKQELAQTKQEHKKKLAQINKFWSSLPPMLQDDWQAEQAAWNKEHQKTCSQSAPFDDAEESEHLAYETSVLTCKIDAIEERMEYLKQKQKEAMEQEAENLKIENTLPPNETESTGI